MEAGCITPAHFMIAQPSSGPRSRQGGPHESHLHLRPPRTRAHSHRIPTRCVKITDTREYCSMCSAYGTHHIWREIWLDRLRIRGPPRTDITDRTATRRARRPPRWAEHPRPGRRDMSPSGWNGGPEWWNGGPKKVERRTEVGGTADQQGGTADQQGGTADQQGGTADQQGGTADQRGGGTANTTEPAVRAAARAKITWAFACVVQVLSFYSNLGLAAASVGGCRA